MQILYSTTTRVHPVKLGYSHRIQALVLWDSVPLCCQWVGWTNTEKSHLLLRIATVKTRWGAGTYEMEVILSGDVYNLSKTLFPFLLSSAIFLFLLFFISIFASVFSFSYSFLYLTFPLQLQHFFHFLRLHDSCKSSSFALCPASVCWCFTTLGKTKTFYTTDMFNCSEISSVV